MTIGFRKTALSLLEALVNETAVKIEWIDQNTMVATIPDVTEPTIQHSITGKCERNIFSDEVEHLQWETILIDQHTVKNMADLKLLGLK